MTKYNNNFKLISLIGVIIVLLFLFTFLGLNSNTLKMSVPNSESSLQVDSYDLLIKITNNDLQLKSILNKLKKDTLNKILIENLIKTANDKKSHPATAFGYYLKGKTENNINVLQQAADLFLNLSSIDSNINNQQFYSKYGKKSCDLIIQTDPQNLNALTRKASFLIYLDNETMSGIKILKEVEKLDSNYIEAQHLLMILALQSNQLEKAEKRLKKLISLQPENSFYKEMLNKIETQQLK